MTLRSRVLALLAVLALIPGAAQARAKESRPTAYDKGAQLYADGKLPQALAIFQAILRREPGDRAALKAARRVEAELARRRPPSRVPDAEALLDWTADDVDELLAIRLPRLLRPEDAVGDLLHAVGTLEAAGGRVSQLLVERRFARKRGRKFLKERELRAAVRRLPAAAV